MRKHYFFLVTGLLLYSCARESLQDYNHNVSPSELSVTVVGHKLSMQNVENYALHLMNAARPATKAKRFQNIQVITRQDLELPSLLPTKSASVNDTLMYVLNHADNEGFLLLASDTRVPILALSDEGQFPSPTTNPGILMFLRMSENYINQSIDDYNRMRGSLQLVAPSITIDTIRPESRIISTSDVLVGTTTKEGQEIVDHVSRLVRTDWGQNTPYNREFEFCPIHPTIQKVAGCVPLAFAQIMAFHKHPARAVNYHYNGQLFTFPWNYIEGPLYQETSTSQDGGKIIGRIARGILLRDVANEIVVKYNCPNHITTAPSIRIGQIMATYGYKKHPAWRGTGEYVTNYSSTDVVSSLDLGLPVYISGDENNGLPGHAWLIDGYKNIETFWGTYQIWRRPNGSTYEKLIKKQYSFYRKTMRCNWGTTGSGNGYFNEGVWNASSQLDGDDDIATTEPYSFKASNGGFTYHVQICTHIYPNK